jgi:hypothetical protein
MDSANGVTEFAQMGRFLLQSIPGAFWLAYNWARDWQVFLGGALVLIAAQIYAQASVRAARIRAAASVRAAQIATGTVPIQNERTEPTFSQTSAMLAPRPPQPRTTEVDLAHKIEQLRSLIRSAMAALGPDVDGAEAGGNIYCERIARLSFDENDLPAERSASTLEVYKKFLMQIAKLRLATARRVAQAELSEILVQLNARARELAAAIAPATTPANPRLARKSSQVRG